MRTETSDDAPTKRETDLDSELARAVQAAAQAEQRIVAGWVRHVLSQHLAQNGHDDD